MYKTIINFCPTGMVPTKALTQYVPIHPNEIIEQVHEAYEIGITIAHLHARNEEETPTYKKSIYQLIFEGVRKYCPELVICGSTSGRNFPEFEKRSEVIELKPDMCSLTLSSLNFLEQASVNSPQIIQRLAMKMSDYGVNPELECFDLGMINYGNYLIKKGIIKAPFYWNLLFGNIAGFQAKPEHFKVSISDIKQPAFIGIGGIGSNQFSTMDWALKHGFGVRVGLEDNIWWNRKDKEYATNVKLVEFVHSKMKEYNTVLLTAKEFGNEGFYNSKRD